MSSIRLYVTGTRATRSRDLIADILAWVRETYPATLCATMRAVDDERRPCLAVSFHPGAEELLLTERDDGGLIAQAVTSTAGPGYHAYVCEVLHALGARFEVTWDAWNPDGTPGDETGYFGTPDRAALEDTMARWLAVLAQRVRALAQEGHKDIALSLPVGREYSHDGLFATPLGPRDAAWLDAACADGRAGFDIFPWAEPGAGAGYFLGRALVRMWTDVRWRTPAAAEEREALEEVTALLEAAYTEDPSRAYPWREWAEMLALLGVDSLLATRAQLRAETAPLAPAIGYRRRDIRLTISGGWSLVVPGDFAETWDEQGTWCAWDGTRTLWFTSFSMKDAKGADRSATVEETLAGLPNLEGEKSAFTAGKVRGIAALGRGHDKGVELQQLRAYAAVPANAAVLTLCFELETDPTWAYEVWRSLRYSAES